MKARLNFGKIDVFGTGKRYQAEVEIRLETVDGKYLEFTACGYVWNTHHTDCIMGGQCLDSIASFIHDPVFREILELWKRWHLNTMKAGTQEQLEILDKYFKDKRWDYEKACSVLEEAGKYEVDYHGPVIGGWHDGPYRYGEKWIVEELPEDVVLRIEHLITTANEKEN